MNSLRLFAISLVLFAASSRVDAQSSVFADSFGNGSVTDADNFTAFWTPNVLTNTTIAEGGGVLTLTAGTSATDTTTINPWVNSILTQDFNFFRRALRLSATVSIGGSAPPASSTAVFSFSSTPNKAFSTPDTIVLSLRGNGAVSLAVKQGAAYASAIALPGLNGVTVPGPITGFELTLDATNYTLKVLHTGGAGSTTFTGAHGLVGAVWGDDGSSVVTMEVTRSAGTASPAVVSVDQLHVDAVNPTSGLFEDNFNNANLTNSDDETGIWTVAAPLSSTALETNGKLSLSAVTPSTDSVIAFASTPVAPRFNFFDHPLRITADVESTGSALVYQRPSCLALASITGNADAAPDVIYVGLREGGILAGTKVDAPNINPESTPSSSIKRLIGHNDGVVDFDYVALGNYRDQIDLTLDAKRFLLSTAHTGKASGLSRFTGAHNLNRSNWGAAGDSALMLESVRSYGSASTTAVTTWDRVRVENSSARLLAEPYADYNVTYATDTNSPPGTKYEYYRVWAPSTEPVIRGVIFIGPGSGDDFRALVHDPVMQDTARALGFALIGYRNTGNMNLWSKNAALIKPAVQAVLDGAAAAINRPEIKNAPLLIAGFSAGSRDSSFLAAYWPERTIGYVALRGGGRLTDTSSFYSIPTAMLTPALQKIPALFIAGGIDTTNDCATVKTNFASWRNAGVQIAYAVDWRIGHTIGRNPDTGAIGNQSWEATMTWLQEVANLRYPRPQLPPTSLANWSFINLADNSGWLGDNPSFSSGNTPSVTSTFTSIAPYASYGGTVSAASWMPNEATARMYRALTSTDLVTTRTVAPLQSPLRIVAPAQYADAVPAGQPFVIRVAPREFSVGRTISKMDFYDNATLLGTDTTGPDWSLSITPTVKGLHTLSVVATGSDGTQSSVFSLLQVAPADFPPVVSPSQTATLPASTAYSGAITAIDPEGDPITYSVSIAPQKGTVTVNSSNGAYTYRPAYRFAGVESFVLRATAGQSFTDVTVSLTVIAPADADGDGMADSWEAANSVSDPNADPDGDGATNLQEYLAGTDPHSAASHLAVVNTVVNAGGASLSWQAIGGVRYRVQYSDNLAAGFTDIVRPVASELQPGAYGAAGVASYTDDSSLTPPSGARRFYRVRIVTGAE